MDGYTKQQSSAWSSPVELDMSACPGTVIRPDMPLGSGPARKLHNTSTPDPMRQQDLYRCPTYCGPRKCPEREAATSPMKCPEKPVCQMPVKCPEQGVSPATMMKCPPMPPKPMKCPPMPPKPMKCPEQGVSPATMKCPEMPPCRMKCPEQGVSPATMMKCPPMPPKPMKCPEQGVSPAKMKCPPMPVCPMKYPDMPPCHMRPEMPMGMAPGMTGGCRPAPAECKGVESIDRYPVAMAYVPWQRWQELYSVDTAIEMGTIFPDLFKPFLMGGCK